MRIQARGFVLTPARKTYIEQRQMTVLGWAGARLHTLRVLLSDINGPRDGCDKRCKIEVQIAGGKSVFIKDTEADLYHVGSVTAGIDMVAGERQ